MTIRRHFTNISALACIQVSNALVPILVFPYALFVLGPGPFSEIVLAEAVSNIVLTLVIFSFEIDGVARVSNLTIRDNRSEIGKIYANIFYARLLIWSVAAVLALGGVAIATGKPPTLMALWLLVPLGYIFHATWLYQGLEQNIPAAVFTLLSRAAAVLIVLLTLKGADTAYVVPMAIGLTFMVGGLASVAYAALVLGLKPQRPEWTEILFLLRHGKEILFGNLSVLLYRDLNVLILGAVGAGTVAVSAYSLTEKLVKMLQATMRPLTQFFFPRLLRRLHGISAPSRQVAQLVMRYTLVQLCILALMVVGIAGVLTLAWCFTDIIRNYPNGEQIILLSAVMVPAIFLGIMNFMFGSAGLNYLNARKYLFYAIFATGLINLIVCAVLSLWLGAFGAAVAFAFAEAPLLIMTLWKYRRAA